MVRSVGNEATTVEVSVFGERSIVNAHGSRHSVPMKSAATLTVCLLLTSISQASTVITNGDFENWSGGNPVGWTVGSGAIATEVSGIDGSGSSMQISGGAYVGQSFTATSDLFNVSVDFTMPQPSSGGRGLNLQLYGGNPTGSSLFLNSRIDHQGNLQYYDGVPSSGGSWKTITLSSQADGWTGTAGAAVYRLVLNGSLSTNEVLFSLFDVTNSTTLVSGASASDPWQFATLDGAATLSEIRFARNNAGTVDYTVDNVAVTIPEPSRAMLTLIGGLGVFFLRRRPIA